MNVPEIKPALFWRIGQNWLCYLAGPFHALFARISCDTFLESLKHTSFNWKIKIYQFYLLSFEVSHNWDVLCTFMLFLTYTVIFFLNIRAHSSLDKVKVATITFIGGKSPFSFLINVISYSHTYWSQILRFRLKNWACHAHLKFKIQKGMEGSIFKPHPPNFEKICISYRCSNDISVIFWYSQPKIHKLKKTNFCDSW